MLLTERQLRKIIRKYLAEIVALDEDDQELLVEPDADERPETEDREDEEETTDEVSTAAAVAGYTLPLGAANQPYSREGFVNVSRKAFGGSRKKKKK